MAARDQLEAAPDLITPMTMMVLAIRLYDVGLRDDAVFWFYVAKGRYMTAAGVLDFKSPALSQVTQATVAFAALAGPFINGYAFCDVERQQQIRGRALAWVEQHPYGAMFVEELPALPGDRRANLARALEEQRAFAAKEQEYIQAHRDEMLEQRLENGIDAKYCTH